MCLDIFFAVQIQIFLEFFFEIIHSLDSIRQILEKYQFSILNSSISQQTNQFSTLNLNFPKTDHQFSVLNWWVKKKGPLIQCTEFEVPFLNKPIQCTELVGQKRQFWIQCTESDYFWWIFFFPPEPTIFAIFCKKYSSGSGPRMTIVVSLQAWTSGCMSRKTDHFTKCWLSYSSFCLCCFSVGPAMTRYNELAIAANIKIILIRLQAPVHCASLWRLIKKI